jgi:DNA-directed RNA polymerase subunit RPC12/RpoP
MATTILIVCPECGKQIKAPDNVLGKKVRCKFCQAAFVASRGGGNKPTGKPGKPSAGKSAPVPAAKPAAAKPSKPAVDDDDDDDGPVLYGLTETSLAPRCPDCANDMEDDQVVCLICGYNTMTREKGKMVMTYDNTFMDKFIWLLPGIACALTVLILIGFDVWYLLQIDKLVGKDDSWYLTMCTSGGIKLWVVIMTLFGIYIAGYFAVKRLILNYKRPEVEKRK